ncbi:ABC transporter permease subunit [Clostridium sp. BL-8]|uniref:ABC transporter permease n=1 Tax=Clostridium sp. BL-8 TaxID=349938 RepID=UPI00098CD9CB|nr:ABC transporter permease subunit [Clostridium sp. BL-8]OOM69015.1 ABC-2 family transporter protein [Clostridium sp. BL-8]
MNELKQFIKLVANELFKTFFQKKTVVFILFIIIAILVIVIGSIKLDKGTTWKIDLESQITNLEKTISDEKTTDTDESIVRSDEERLELLKYRLAHNIPENVITPLRFVYNCNKIVTFIVLFMAIFSANIIAEEYSKGSIRQLLIKPVKRWEIFTAKFCSVALVSIILCSLLFIISLIIGLILFSKNSSSINDVILSNGNLVERNMLQYVILSSLSDVFSIVVISSLSFLVATIVRTAGLSIIISISVYFGGLIGVSFLKNNPIYKYMLTPNLSLSSYLPGGNLPFEGASFSFSLIICIIYLIIFLFSGLYIFSIRDVY